jgi:hypothetical protein
MLEMYSNPQQQVVDSLFVQPRSDTVLEESTRLSRFLSHRSLIVHPAPRITTAPTPKRPSMEKSWEGGRCACAEANVILHAIRQNSLVREEPHGQ